MTKQDVENKFFGIFAKFFTGNCQKISRGAAIIEVLGEPGDKVLLISKLEEEFEIYIPLFTFQTVDELINYIINTVSEKEKLAALATKSL